MDISKFKNNLQCICNANIVFEVIDEIECDWGSHTVIQCPICEELFSVDKKCPAFKNILELQNYNSQLFSKNDKSDYLSNSHP